MEYIDTAVIGPADPRVYNCTTSERGHWSKAKLPLLVLQTLDNINTFWHAYRTIEDLGIFISLHFLLTRPQGRVSLKEAINIIKIVIQSLFHVKQVTVQPVIGL